MNGRFINMYESFRVHEPAFACLYGQVPQMGRIKTVVEMQPGQKPPRPVGVVTREGETKLRQIVLQAAARAQRQ